MVEKWLLQVEETMIASVRKVISESFNAYANSLRSNWVLEWPGQIVICVSSIFWTAEVSDAMKQQDGVQVRIHAKRWSICVDYRYSMGTTTSSCASLLSYLLTHWRVSKYSAFME